jgi:DNA-binding NarL/FixJ family response regulator
MIAIIAFASALVAILTCFSCLASNRKRRAELRSTTDQLGRLEHDLYELSRDFDTATERATHQARRIAWLESRVHPGKQLEALHTPETSFDKGRSPITERRHRVLTLARRGQAAEAIAATLNMAQGEVELIIGLSKAA